MTHKDPWLRSALYIQGCLQGRETRPSRGSDERIETVLGHSRALEQQLRLLHSVRPRRWTAATNALQRRTEDALRQLSYSVAEAVNHPIEHTPSPVLLRDVYQDLLQLQEEFERVELGVNHIISAVTDAIELEGIELGDFEIRLHLPLLVNRPDVRAFEIIALNPHPAAASEDVIHPHVRDGQLCAGDATVLVTQALRSGRICDAFLAVSAVLHQYNPGSPYVRLDEWSGTACADCGQVVDEEHRYYCEGCNQDYCEECFSYCAICESSYCRGCLEEDRESQRLCCSGCRRRCNGCGRTVDADTFIEETGLCPACHDERLEEELQQEQQEEVNDEQQQPDPREQDDAIAASGSAA